MTDNRAKVTLRASSTAKPQRLRAVDHLNLLILIGGTTQPVNMGTNHGSDNDSSGDGSQGHSDGGVVSGTDYWGMSLEDLAKLGLEDVDWYWQKDAAFRAKLASMEKEYISFKIFAAHGWSGDNSIDNRKVAGAYLANRLCGAEGEKPFYPAWRNKRVDIHILGHSHGGNVVNEFTRQTAKLEKAWPARWRIRSVTYLSTPFFRNLHPVDTATFDPECRIINVCDDYDLTQRVIADFSMLPLRNVLQHARADELLATVAGMKLAPDVIVEALSSARPDVNFGWTIGVEIDWKMDPQKGAKLYDHLLELLRGLDATFTAANRVIDNLTTPLKYPIAPGLNGKIKTERPILSPQSASQCKALLRRAQEAVNPFRARIEARRNSGVYPLQGFFDDLIAQDSLTVLITRLVELIDIDTTTLSGPILDLITSVALDQVDQFDDTVRTPAAQLAGTAFEQKVTHVDVTGADRYASIEELKPYRAHFPAFISRLEQLEAAYAQHGNRRDITDLLLNLLAQLKPIREMVETLKNYEVIIDYGGGFLSGMAQIDAALEWIREKSPVLELLARLGEALEHWYTVLSTRDAGAMEVPLSVAASDDPTEPPIGSVAWFALVSHSVSRRQLHAPVEAALRAQITSLKKTVK